MGRVWRKYSLIQQGDSFVKYSAVKIERKEDVIIHLTKHAVYNGETLASKDVLCYELQLVLIGINCE